VLSGRTPIGREATVGIERPCSGLGRDGGVVFLSTAPLVGRGVDTVKKAEKEKVYEKPAVIATTVIEARAVTCAKDSSTTGGCESGPIGS